MGLAVLAQVTRSGFVEGVHHGSAVALDGDGSVVHAVGEPGATIFPRSSNKPFQSAAMVHAGLDLPEHLLALASASHSGEGYHRDGVLRLLASAGLDETHLQNTPDRPLDAAERLAWASARRPSSSLAQNCSGKHAAMLATCVANGWDLHTYTEPGHPLQKQIAEVIAGLAGEPVAATGVDGCGAPVMAISLLGLARAASRLASASSGGTSGSAEGRVALAMSRHPEWVGGTGRDVTALMRAVPGLVAKDGAEAVYVAALPDGRAAAVKIADGGDRARVPVLVALLRRLGVDAPEFEALESSPVLGAGRPVGAVEAVL